MRSLLQNARSGGRREGFGGVGHGSGLVTFRDGKKYWGPSLFPALDVPRIATLDDHAINWFGSRWSSQAFPRRRHLLRGVASTVMAFIPSLQLSVEADHLFTSLFEECGDCVLGAEEGSMIGWGPDRKAGVSSILRTPNSAIRTPLWRRSRRFEPDGSHVRRVEPSPMSAPRRTHASYDCNPHHAQVPTAFGASKLTSPLPPVQHWTVKRPGRAERRRTACGLGFL